MKKSQQTSAKGQRSRAASQVDPLWRKLADYKTGHGPSASQQVSRSLPNLSVSKNFSARHCGRPNTELHVSSANFWWDFPSHLCNIRMMRPHLFWELTEDLYFAVCWQWCALQQEFSLLGAHVSKRQHQLTRGNGALNPLNAFKQSNSASRDAVFP